MADLSFLDKLDQEQLQNADKIISKAEKIGVDPKLALTLAYTESGLRQNTKDGVLTGSAGEIGLMQIKPNTAKLVGFDAKQLTDPDANIEAGLTYLKQNIDRYKDPMLGALAYNIGPDAAFFSGKGDAPEQGLSYVNKIQGLGGFAPTEKQADVRNEVTPASEEDYRSLKAAGLGAGAGALAGEAASIGRGVIKTSQAIQQLPEALRQVAYREGAPVPTDLQHTRQMQGTTQEGATGRARMQTFNEQTAQQAAARKEAEAAMQRLKNMGIITGDNPLAKTAGVTSTPSGVLLPAGTVYEPKPVPKPSPLQTMKTTGRNVMGAVMRSPVVSGALAGAGAGFGAQEAFERYDKDKLGSAIAGMGALGSLASMVPTLPTRVIGGGLAMASPAALAVLDRIRKTESQPATEQEMQQAQQPAFRYARP